MTARPLLLAHRGDHRAAPENTLGALAAAVAVGCDGMELDVRRSRDGQAIVLHDATLQRVQGLAVAAADLSAAELAGQGVPTLVAVLTAAPAGFLLDVEIKDPAAVGATIAAVEGVRGPAAVDVVISSFDAATLGRIGEARPGWIRWLIGTGDRTVDGAAALGCGGVALAVAALDAGVVARAHELGLTVVAWTVRDAATRDRLVAQGVDAMCVEGGALPG